MVWLPVKFPKMCFGGETPNHRKKKKKKSTSILTLEFFNPCVFFGKIRSICLLYIKMFPGEYLTSKNFRTVPHFPFSAFCISPLLQHVRTGMHTSEGEPPGTPQAAPLSCLKGWHLPASHQVRQAGRPRPSLCFGTVGAACRAS